VKKMPRRVVISGDIEVPSTKRIPVSSDDFDKVVDEIGEPVTIYTPTQEVDDDYGSFTSSSLGDGAVENAFIDKANLVKLPQLQGEVKLGDAMFYLKGTSIVDEGDMVKVNGSGIYYRIKVLFEYRIGGHKHHYEALAEFVKE